ncbi:hypothetical protein [Dehalobacter sp. TBBPA1]
MNTYFLLHLSAANAADNHGWLSVVMPRMARSDHQRLGAGEVFFIILRQ